MTLISVLTPSIRPVGLDATMKTLEAQTLQDFEWLVELGMPWRGSDLNAAYNRMLRRARGEIVVSLQDYIEIPPDALAIIADLHQLLPKTLFTYPVVIVQADGTERKDWRSENGRVLLPGHMWEIDFASAPLAALQEVGGFDETYDAGWSWDNVSVGMRAVMAGYQVALCPDFGGRAVDHDELMEHPFRGKNENGHHNEAKLAEYQHDWKLHYLDTTVGA